MDTIFYLQNETLVATLAGEIDHHSADRIRSDIDDELRLYDVKDLVFDFSDVTFMDSSGIGVVLGRYKKIRAAGGRVVIRNANSLVRKILEMSGVFMLEGCSEEQTEEKTEGVSDGKECSQHRV